MAPAPRVHGPEPPGRGAVSRGPRRVSTHWGHTPPWSEEPVGVSVPSPCCPPPMSLPVTFLLPVTPRPRSGWEVDRGVLRWPSLRLWGRPSIALVRPESVSPLRTFLPHLQPLPPPPSPDSSRGLSPRRGPLRVPQVQCLLPPDSTFRESFPGPEDTGLFGRAVSTPGKQRSWPCLALRLVTGRSSPVQGFFTRRIHAPRGS